MLRHLISAVACAFLAAVELTGCGGAGGMAAAPAPVAAAPDAVASNSDISHATAVRVGPTAVTAAIPFAQEFSGSITLRSSHGGGVTIGVAQYAAALGAHQNGSASCPAIPPIVVTNPFPFAITVELDALRVRLPCSVDGLLFGASAYQSSPVPQTLVSIKLGDAQGKGRTLAFTPTTAQLTFPARSSLTISVLPETSTAFTQLPALANTSIVLTSNAPSVPNSLALAFPNAHGGMTFASACYLPGDPAGPGLGGTHVLGTPAFYCVLVPGEPNVTTTFGGANPNDVVTFRLGPNAKPDASLIGLDGPPLYAACTPAAGAQLCSAPPFGIPAYSKAYVSNDADIAVCVPATENTDCNGVGGNPKAPSATSVAPGQAFALLFADDPSYNAPNTFGGVTLQVQGQSPACTIVTGPDANGDVPPGYSDPGTPPGATPLWADFTGAGPYVEFDIRAHAAGTCTIDLTEDTGLKRTFAFSIPVESAPWGSRTREASRKRT